MKKFILKLNFMFLALFSYNLNAVTAGGGTQATPPAAGELGTNTSALSKAFLLCSTNATADTQTCDVYLQTLISLKGTFNASSNSKAELAITSIQGTSSASLSAMAEDASISETETAGGGLTGVMDANNIFLGAAVEAGGQNKFALYNGMDETIQSGGSQPSDGKVFGSDVATSGNYNALTGDKCIVFNGSTRPLASSQNQNSNAVTVSTTGYADAAEDDTVDKIVGHTTHTAREAAFLLSAWAGEAYDRADTLEHSDALTIVYTHSVENPVVGANGLTAKTCT